MVVVEHTNAHLLARISVEGQLKTKTELEYNQATSCTQRYKSHIYIRDNELCILIIRKAKQVDPCICCGYNATTMSIRILSARLKQHIAVHHCMQSVESFHISLCAVEIRSPLSILSVWLSLSDSHFLSHSLSSQQLKMQQKLRTKFLVNLAPKMRSFFIQNQVVAAAIWELYLES